MFKQRSKARGPFAKSLANNLFHQLIVESKKKKEKKFNWKNNKHLGEDYLSTVLMTVFE